MRPGPRGSEARRGRARAAARGPVGLVPVERTPEFQDVYDHVLRATEWTESLRDLVATIVETNLTIQGNRLNIITKKVTSWAAIIAVPTAITDFYGQNLPYPGFSNESGFVASSVIIVTLPGGLYAAFRRRRSFILARTVLGVPLPRGEALFLE